MATPPPIPPVAGAPGIRTLGLRMGYVLGAVFVVFVAAGMIAAMRQRHEEESRPVATLSPETDREKQSPVRMRRYMGKTPVDLLYMDWIPQGECRAIVEDRPEGEKGRVVHRASGPCGTNSFRMELEGVGLYGSYVATLTDAGGKSAYTYFFYASY